MTASVSNPPLSPPPPQSKVVRVLPNYPAIRIIYPAARGPGCAHARPCRKPASGLDIYRTSARETAKKSYRIPELSTEEDMWSIIICSYWSKFTVVASGGGREGMGGTGAYTYGLLESLLRRALRCFCRVHIAREVERFIMQCILITFVQSRCTVGRMHSRPAGQTAPRPAHNTTGALKKAAVFAVFWLGLDSADQELGHFTVKRNPPLLYRVSMVQCDRYPHQPKLTSFHRL